MAVLAWGKCVIEYTTSENGAPKDTSWKAIDTPKEDTVQINLKPGNEVLAKEEGGGVVDAMYEKGTCELVFDLFLKKGQAAPFTDNDGIVAGEYSFRIYSESNNTGFQLDRCKVQIEKSFTTKDGILLKHVCKALKPKTGNFLKDYTKA